MQQVDITIYIMLIIKVYIYIFIRTNINMVILQMKTLEKTCQIGLTWNKSHKVIQFIFKDNYVWPISEHQLIHCFLLIYFKRSNQISLSIAAIIDVIIEINT